MAACNRQLNNNLLPFLGRAWRNLINSKDLSIMIPGEKFYRARDNLGGHYWIEVENVLVKAESTAKMMLPELARGDVAAKVA
jgi:hypothetical protein